MLPILLETLIEHVNRLGVTILLIEHKMSLVMKLSRVVTVLNFEGSPRGRRTGCSEIRG